MLIGSIAILVRGEKIERTRVGQEILFAVIGAVTSFYCFLSSPFIALGIPLIVLIWCTKESAAVKRVISCSCYWFGAYAVTWAMKWIICTLFTSYNLIENVFDRVDVYENVDNIENSGTSLIERFMSNLWVYKTPAFMCLYLIAVIVTTVACFRKWTLIIDAHAQVNGIIDVIVGYSIIECIPFVLFLVLGNGYAYNHYFMAHRNLSITVLASL